MYLTRTLGEQLLHLAETTHGYPEQYDGIQSWQEALRMQAKKLLRYSQHFDSDRLDFDDELSEAREALSWVAENLPHLWD